tara:strand:+ start:221 stop:658 length:438 start_codon:yes stop_codon:yes gene_type:complete
MDTILSNFTNMEVDEDNIDVLSTNFGKTLFVDKDFKRESRTLKAQEIYNKVVLISESVEMYEKSELYIFFLDTKNIFQIWYKELFYLGWEKEDYSDDNMKKILSIKSNMELFNQIFDADIYGSITLISSILYDLFVLNNIFEENF